MHLARGLGKVEILPGRPWPIAGDGQAGAAGGGSRHRVSSPQQSRHHVEAAAPGPRVSPRAFMACESVSFGSGAWGFRTGGLGRLAVAHGAGLFQAPQRLLRRPRLAAGQQREDQLSQLAGKRAASGLGGFAAGSQALIKLARIGLYWRAAAEAISRVILSMRLPL